MHATSRRSAGRKVILDGRISKYLRGSNDHYGIVIYRPFDLAAPNASNLASKE
jgi:hypothetical protein